jgi:hypothetical protein
VFSVAKLGTRYLDFQFTTRYGARARIVERPGRWMAEAELARLVEDLRSVVRASLPAGSLDYGVLTGDPERLRNAILTVIYAGDGRPVAFNALAILDCELRGRPVEVIHLGLVMIDPGYRAKGVSGILYGLTCFLLYARRQMRTLWFSNVTQVPAVFGMVGEAFANVFPDPARRARRSFEHLVLARQVLARHRHVFGVGPEAGFDERRFVITNAYTGGSDNLKKPFAAAAQHRREIFNETCRCELDYERGDDFLQIGQFDLRAARDYFRRSLPTLSARALLQQFGFLFAESLLLPLMHWATPSQELGSLRPWPN